MNGLYRLSRIVVKNIWCNGSATDCDTSVVTVKPVFSLGSVNLITFWKKIDRVDGLLNTRSVLEGSCRSWQANGGEHCCGLHRPGRSETGAPPPPPQTWQVNNYFQTVIRRPESLQEFQPNPVQKECIIFNVRALLDRRIRYVKSACLPQRSTLGLCGIVSQEAN